MIEMNAPAESRYHALPRVPESCAMATVIGATSRVPPRNTSETSRSFQTHRNWKMPNAAIAGVSSGSRILKKIVTCPAPSTRAASISSPGSSLMKLWMRKVARGSAKIVCDSHTLQYDAPMPRVLT